MFIEVIGRDGFNPSEANKAYVMKRLKKLEDFFGEDAELRANVVIKVKKAEHKVEVTIPTKNLIMRAEVVDTDLYSAIDRVSDKLLQQIRKHKAKIKSKLDKEGIKTQVPADPLEEETVEGVVKNKTVDLEPMTLDEAISQMELLGHDFFVYLSKETHKVNVIYLRSDGKYANIETR